jgi:sialate O-acetylesterase
MMSRHPIAVFASLAAFMLGMPTGRAPRYTPISPAPPTLRLARLFGDGMVVQRDAAIPVWGWAAPGDTVTVTFAGRTERATADGAGAWRVTFPAMAAGGPHSLTVQSGGERIALGDVMIGDVWVASGQSNMEMTVAAANDADREIAAAHDPLLRHFKVPLTWSWQPEDDLAGGSWAAADPAHVGDFTAVGYFFGRALRGALDVPIGIINTSWGGSAIEAWISRGASGLDDLAWAHVIAREEVRRRETRETLEARIGTLPTEDEGLVNGVARWADPALNDSAWSSIRVPGLWEEAGYPDMDGVAWYRTSFTLTPAEAQREVRLAVGAVDDEDITWVNGVEVGRMQRYDAQRLYDVPAAALRAGSNVVAVRVLDTGGGGGIWQSPEQVYVEVGGVRRPLAGTWKFKVGIVTLNADGQRINKIPTVLYNRMLHPLLPFPIKGVIWYQGESNANDLAQAKAYRGQLATLIRSWRREWGGAGGDFPFLWVQLPNFGPVDTVPPANAAWATLRESETAALALPNTGQAVTIDVGEPGDIHPRDKQDVGARLALVARSVAYGADLVSSGPVYRRHSIRDGRVEVEFDHAEGGLVSRAGGDEVIGFAVAGEDRRFVWAHARIDGNRVIVRSEHVQRPVAVRYAWSNSPPAPSLYNGAGLPAAPFRTDAW